MTETNLMIAAGIFHPESGGPATYLKEILPALQARGWQPHVLTYGNDTYDDYPYAVKRIARQALPVRLGRYYLASRALTAQADLIYAHTIDLPIAWRDVPRVIKIVGDQAWERCIRRGWIVPTTDIDAFQHERMGFLAERQKALRSAQVRDFDAVIVPSAYLKQMVVGWGVDEAHVHVVYNAMPPVTETMPHDKAEVRAELGWDSRPVIFTAARLTPWKGIDHLIAAVHRVPDVRLVVAGDGQDMSRLRSLARPLGERVQLLGRIAREDVYRHMKAADFFALYSGYEGLPHTVLEALRVGTPIIASDKGGNPEVVQDGVNGVLVPYVDEDALVAQIKRALAQHTTLAENTQVGMEQFTFDAMVQATDTVLRQYV